MFQDCPSNIGTPDIYVQMVLDSPGLSLYIMFPYTGYLVTGAYIHWSKTVRISGARFLCVDSLGYSMNHAVATKHGDIIILLQYTYNIYIWISYLRQSWLMCCRIVLDYGGHTL